MLPVIFYNDNDWAALKIEYKKTFPLSNISSKFVTIKNLTKAVFSAYTGYKSSLLK